MPTYSYECLNCKKIEDHFHGIKEDKVILCSKCNHKMVRLISGGSGVIFKGDGWTPKHHKRSRE